MFARGDICYILENNMRVRSARVINRIGKSYTIQFVGACGAIRLPESRLFKTEEQALASKKESELYHETKSKDDYGYIDVFGEARKGKSPH